MINQQVYSKDIIEFVTVGIEYCTLIENVKENNRKEFLTRLVRILPLLYLKATLLPDEEIDETDNLEHHVTEEYYMYLAQNISDVLGDENVYLEVFEKEMAISDTPLTATISENLADIYQDVRDLLEIYRLGDEDLSRAAICRCRENFIEYWGQSLVNAMRPLHAITFNNDADDYDFNDNADYQDNDNDGGLFY